MKIQVTNLTQEPVHLGDFYTTVRGGGSIEVERSAGELSGLKTVHKAVQEGLVAVALTATSETELAFVEVPPGWGLPKVGN